MDSIAASPTVRLALEDDSIWSVHESTDFGMPSVDRAVVSTLLVDGGQVPASAYGLRQLSLVVTIDTASENVAATELQKLFRELNRPTNILRWRPDVTNPAFFRTFRSDVAQIHWDPMLKRVMATVLAEPFAYGVREDVTVGTVTNDPAAATRGGFFDVTDVKGDVATPLIIKDTSSGLHPFGVLAARSRGTPSDLVWFAQAEDTSVITFGANTTNPGGGPDAAMSGTATNNFVRTTFGTATMVNRLRWAIVSSTTTDGQKKAIRGTYRVFVVVRRSGATSDITARISWSASWSGATAVGPTTVIPKTVDRQLVDLGLFNVGSAEPIQPGRFGAEAPLLAPDLNIEAARSGAGTDTLDWDLILLLPADESWLSWFTKFGEDTSYDALIDGVTEAVYVYENAADPFAGAADIFPTKFAQFSGGFPVLNPGATNRIFMLTSLDVATPGVTTSKSSTYTISAHYYPRYLYVRPATT